MQVELIRVFVSSPGDVSEERQVLEEVVASINKTDGEAGGFRLELFKWEDNVARQIGPTPQRNVDDQTPDYEIYIGIMSRSFGTPTGHYDSGTKKEFEAALSKWKQTGTPSITFYFDAQPKMTGDPADAEQFVKVCEFRTSLVKQGLVHFYSGVRGSADSFFETASVDLRRIVALRRLPLTNCTLGDLHVDLKIDLGRKKALGDVW